MNRDSLSFTKRDDSGLLINWLPGPGNSDTLWGDGVVRGRARFAEVRRLVQSSPAEARKAIKYAITSRDWRTGNGEEHGFAEALAHAAVEHLIAQGLPSRRIEHPETFRAQRVRPRK